MRHILNTNNAWQRYEVYYTYEMADLIIRDISVELRNHFKAVCAMKGKTVKEELIRLMQEEVEKEQKGKLY